jgi:hypothetical protein
MCLSDIHAQSRASGGAVVPYGYENEDSLRFMLVGMEDPAYPPCNPGSGKAYIDSLADQLGANFEGSFGWIGPKVKLTGRRKGILSKGWTQIDTSCHANPPKYFPLDKFLQQVKQRVYHALPYDLVDRYGQGNGFFWRYNAVNGIDVGDTSYNNTDDANDISPYSEYPKRHAYVVDTFHSRRFNAAIDSAVTFGNEGRVILGMSDDRLTKQMMQTLLNGFFPTSGHANDTARMFSTTLEFNINSDSTQIDTAGANVRYIADAPLLRIQVLFKKGTNDNSGTPGWPTLPMVPFMTSESSPQTGWYRVIDQTISKRMYDTLAADWRYRDTLQSGGYSHSGWTFKQLHLNLSGMPSFMRNMLEIDTADYQDGHWGVGAADTSRYWSYVHPDFLTYESSDHGEATDKISYLEIRILSMYRATVRVRGLTYQDTLVDKYLYRKLDGSGVSHSCNPDGRIGGFDDSVKRVLQVLADSLGVNTPREVLINDVGAWEKGSLGPISIPTMGYIEYLGASKGI